jgi:flagellar biosynthetic protein FliO
LSLVSLAIVCFVAFFVLRWLNRKGIGRSDGCIHILGHCFLEPRRSVYVIEVGGRCFLLGVGEGPMSLLAEIDKATLSVPTSGSDMSGTAFSQVLARVLRRRGR